MRIIQREYTSQISSILTDISNTLDHDAFALSLNSRAISSIGSKDKKYNISPETLASKWNIGLEAAKRTLKATTQRGIRSSANPSIARRFRTNDRQLRYNRLNTDLFTDTMFSTVKSSRGNTCGQVYSNDLEWTRFFPMTSKSMAHESLDLLFKRDGVPRALISDGAHELVQGQFRKKARAAGCHCKETEPHSQFSNRSEGCVREVKRSTRRAMLRTPAPHRLWDYCAELQASIRSNTAHDLFTLGGQVPETLMTGSTADISELCEFRWYQWVYFRDSVAKFPEEEEVLGRYLCPSSDIGPVMCMYILKGNNEVVTRSTLRPLTQVELDSDSEKEKRDAFDKAIKEGPLGARMTSNESDDLELLTPTFEPYGDDSGDPVPEVEDEFDTEALDNYLQAEVLHNIGGEQLS